MDGRRRRRDNRQFAVTVIPINPGNYERAVAGHTARPPVSTTLDRDLLNMIGKTHRDAALIKSIIAEISHTFMSGTSRYMPVVPGKEDEYVISLINAAMNTIVDALVDDVVSNVTRATKPEAKARALKESITRFDKVFKLATFIVPREALGVLGLNDPRPLNRSARLIVGHDIMQTQMAEVNVPYPMPTPQQLQQQQQAEAATAGGE